MFVIYWPTTSWIVYLPVSVMNLRIEASRSRVRSVEG